MSEMNEDLKRQLAERGRALLSDYLERKPGYDGPTLTPDDEAKLKAAAKLETIEERLRAESAKR
jgi:hypothetical protein